MTTSTYDITALAHTAIRGVLNQNFFNYAWHGCFNILFTLFFY